MPWEKNVSITPLPEMPKAEYMRECTAGAEAKGARDTLTARRQPAHWLAAHRPRGAQEHSGVGRHVSPPSSE